MNHQKLVYGGMRKTAKMSFFRVFSQQKYFSQILYKKLDSTNCKRKLYNYPAHLLYCCYNDICLQVYFLTRFCTALGREWVRFLANGVKSCTYCNHIRCETLILCKDLGSKKLILLPCPIELPDKSRGIKRAGFLYQLGCYCLLTC